MFKRVLIANRGEIAIRIARSLREMNIESVAVYSESDRGAPHVRAADAACLIGPSNPKDSYLSIERVLDAARASGADALHPGYGFLSENPELALACEASGIAFVGPPPSAVRLLGDKVSARAHAQACGLPIAPGARVDTVEEALAAADTMGYPVFLKPSAGGGGKGMRRVTSAAELQSQFARSRSESESSFGDGTLYLEKAIVGARHVEIQVMLDQHGAGVHLFERDCSVQRRHQKVIEETPAPGVERSAIEQLGAQCVAAAKAAGYFSAGTFEFLLDAEGRFYFLEVNTRLQVEHPITELVVGVDLVREMLRVAAGEPLSWQQDELFQRGSALECRIYAEDPWHDFLPSSGTIEHLSFPSGPGVRVDSGVEASTHVGSYYDPLLAKLSVWGTDRRSLLARARRAIRECTLLGVETNIELLARVLDLPDFDSGQYSTDTLVSKLPELLAKEPALSAELVAALAVATELDRRASPFRAEPSSPWLNTHRARVLRR